MNTPPSSHDDRDPLSAALRRDAARMEEPPFDPALHHATLRRIRAMADSRPARWSDRWKLALASTAALAGIVMWISSSSQKTAPRTPPQPDFAAAIASERIAVAELSTDTSPLPAWISPTASLLDLPRLSNDQTKQPQ